MDPSRPRPKADFETHRPDLDQIEQWARETAWENEGGRALKDDNRPAAMMNFGVAANDNGTAAP
jgi:hypothetical protein